MRAPYLLPLLAMLAQAQPKKEEPVGLVLNAGGAKVLRAGTETPLAARAGDILFAGDALRTEAAPATFLFCPGKVAQTIAPSTEVVLTTGALKPKTGKLETARPVASCFLPQVVRVATATQQHYGVSMTRGLQKPPEPTAVPPEKFPPEAAAELSAVEKALAADANDQAALVARSAIFEKYKLLPNALADYRKIGSAFPDAVWVKGKIFELEELLANQAAQAAAAAPLGGKTYALLVGVSQYQKLPQELWLHFAHADAEILARHLSSARGGAIPPEDMVLLTNEKATTAALRNAFQTFLKGRAGKKDTVIIMIAGHGTVETPGSKDAFILTHDSDPQDLKSTAIPMADIQDLIQEQLSHVGRVAVFVDVCRAGTIGTIRSTTVNAVVERLAEAEGEIFGLMASRPKELSYEGPQFGGGHGAFSYALVKALSGEADKNKDQVVNVNEIIEYVRDKVAEETQDKQHPRDFGTIDNAVALSDLKKPGIEIAHFPFVYDSAGGPLYLASAAQQPPLSGETNAAIQRFEQALAAGRLLPDAPDSAFQALRPLQSLPPQRYTAYENQLRIALEDRAQQVLLRYLTGDEVPQNRQDFLMGARYTEAAKRLTPESLFLEGRREFFEGRALLFDKNFAQAGRLIEQAIRTDPAGAYGYNALGIAYLEQGDFDRAIPAFRDAVRNAPHWAYPRHNLALAYVETGNYNGAIRAYEEAMRIQPGFMYLPYNLGLVYQRLNRRKEAERAYRRALELRPESGEPYNALGSLKASEGKRAEAEELYRQALAKAPELIAARHNLALLLAASPSRRAEAVKLWRENLAQDAAHLPSRLALAETLAAQGDAKSAADEYGEALRIRPEYTAARLARSDLLLKLGDSEAARRELREVVARDAANSAAWERMGDLEASAKRVAEARSAYEKALAAAADGSARKRVRKKMSR
jgi:tetratricopeptide (TPR) repeat protein